MSRLQKGDRIVSAGQLIPGDGKVVEGVALVDESAVNGVSSPLIREAGGDRSDVSQGARVLSGCVVVRMAAPSSRSFLERIGFVHNKIGRP